MLLAFIKDENLVQPVDRSKNPWHSFIEEHPDFANIPEIMLIDDQASLVQTFTALSKSIEDIFNSLNVDFTGNCFNIGVWRISSQSEGKYIHFVGL